MRLEAGKKYTDRRGRVYGPLIEDSNTFYEDECGTNWWFDGRVSTKKESLADLVAEYVEPVPVESPEDWVMITDLSHILRKSCDQIQYGGDANGSWHYVDGAAGMSVAGWGYCARCRRKDLPAASIESLANVVADVIIDAMGEPDPATYPQYWTSKDEKVAYGVCLSPNTHKWVHKDGNESTVFEISMHGMGDRKQISEAEAFALVKKPETYPQYWTKARCAPREVAFVRRISATAFVVVHEDGTESGQLFWLPHDSVYRKQMTKEEAMVLLNKSEPVESPDDWVAITNQEHLLRKRCDQIQYSDDINGPWYDVDGSDGMSVKTWGHAVRCRRKDLPVVPEKSVLQKVCEASAKCMDCTTCGDFCEKSSKPTEVWPKWFQIAEGHIAEFPETGGSTNYRRGEKDTEGYPASHYHGQFPEFWKQITSFDAMSLMSKWGHIENATPKTRTVTLREWACWEDERESDVTLVWSSRDPTIDDDGFIGWDNAVLTGDVRSIELPVSQ